MREPQDDESAEFIVNLEQSTDFEEIESGDQAKMEEACKPCCEALAQEEPVDLGSECEDCDCPITLSNQLLKTIVG